jgi:hypothetical protein
MERNAWMVLRSLANSNGVATVSYESLRTALLCAPGSQKAAPASVSRAVLCLRLTAWIDQTGCRRDPRTGFSRGASYTVRTEPLSFTEACLGNEDYLPLLEHGLEHKHVTLRQLARDILDQAMLHSDELAQLPPTLQEEVKRLRKPMLRRMIPAEKALHVEGNNPISTFPHLPLLFRSSLQKRLRQYVQYKTMVIKYLRTIRRRRKRPGRRWRVSGNWPPISKIIFPVVCKPCPSSNAGMCWRNGMCVVRWGRCAMPLPTCLD